MRILLVEDDHELGMLVASFLGKESYACDIAPTLEKARHKLDAGDAHDLIIMDVVLPDGNGVQFCRELREGGLHTPILMLTSKKETLDRVSGLDAGADDYMPKPFSPNELGARIRALLRRPKQTLPEEIVCGDISLNLLSHSAKIGNKTLDLMPKEYNLLEYLMRKKNQVVKRDELLQHVWGIYSQSSSNRLEVYIRYLREKIDIPTNSHFIQTIRGSGYKIADDS